MKRGLYGLFALGVCLGIGVEISSAGIGLPKKLSSFFHKKSGPLTRAWVAFTEKPSAATRVPLAPEALKRRWKAGFRKTDAGDLSVNSEYRAALERLGVKVRSVSRWFNAASIEATPEQLAEIERLPFVRAVKPMGSVPRKPREPLTPLPKKEERRFIGEQPNPEGLNYGLSQAQLEQIGLTELHRRGLTGKDVVVAIFDEGFKRSHEVFKSAKVRAAWDFVQGDAKVESDPKDPNDYTDEHGTMTWSVLGGWAPGRLIGAAFGATFLLARTEDARTENPVEEDYWIAALEWAEAQGADIVSSSLGYRDFNSSSDNHPFSSLDGQTLMISRAANLAAERGILIVNAVGNDGKKGPQTLDAPSDAFGVLAVGAVNRLGVLAAFSSRGPTADGRIKPDVLAQGVLDVVATDTGYSQASGTSFSAPLVAGAAALILEAHRDWTPQQLRMALTKTASKGDRPDEILGYGYGIIDAVKVLDSAAPKLVATAQ